MFDEEASNVVEFDVCLLGGHVGRACHPPVGTWQTGRQVCPAPCPVLPVRTTWVRQDFAVSRLEQTDARLLRSEDDRVEPTPYDQVGTVRSRREGYEVTWPEFGGAWLERRRVSHRRRPTLPEDLAGLGNRS